MKNLKRSIASVILVLLLLLSSFVPSFASESGVLTYSSEYNSGTRNVVCTTLEGTSAASYYTGNYTYDYLSELSAESLFSSLQTLMRSTQTYTSSYDDCHYEADRTDCQNGDKSVSLIYTGYSATMDEWNGWNREHVWPKSNGGNSETGGGADLHHIRPSDSGVNSSRGNKKYGESGSNPTEKYGTDPAVGWLGGTFNNTYFEPLDNVKGDVARICLYVYVRWNSDWGAEDVTKVFQSVDVLLAWCEADPVDTWEMGRNEVVQDIQGNRNVFIDYPEYAWLIFGREVPTNMATPSGEASGGELGGGSAGGGSSDCSHTNKTTTTTNATCTVAGSIIVTCTDCGATVSNTTIAATGHSYVDGECSVCGEIQSADPTWVLVKDTTELKAGDKVVIVAKDYNYAMSTTQNSNNRAQASATKNGDTVTFGNDVQVLTLEEGKTSGTFAFNTDSGYLYAASSSKNYLRTETELSANSSWNITVEADGVATIEATGANTHNCLRYNSSSSIFAAYASGQQDVVIYKLVEASGGDACEHTNTTTTTIDATCTEAGSIIVTCTDCDATVSNTTIPATGHQNTSTSTTDATCTEAGSIIVTCTDCGATVSNTTIPVTEHSYVDGKCSVCGATLSIYTCTFVSAEDSTAYSVSGSSIIMPGAPSLTNSYKKDYVFIGWTTSTVEDTTSSPVIHYEGDEVPVSSDTTFYALYSYEIEGQSSPGFEEKDIADISSTDIVVITVTTSGGTVYALPNNGGASTPDAIVITVNGTAISGTVADSLKWNIVKSGDNFIIYPNGDTTKWLYCTNSNSGVRVGTDDVSNAFTIDATTKYLKNIDKGRYIGVYTTNPDWRSYTNTTGNIANQTLKFYVYSTGGTTVFYTTELLYDCSHTRTTVETVSATCTEAGSITVTCDSCGETVSYTVTDPTGHTYVDEICIRCGYTENNTSQAPTGEGWTLVTDATELKAGDKIVIISGEFVAGNISSAFLASVSGVTVSDNTITTLPDGAIILTLGGSEGAWTLSNDSGQLLGATAVKKLAWDSGTTTWSISIADDVATIQNGTSSYGRMLYNVTYPRFTTYTSNPSSSMLLPQIYKYIEASGDSGEIEISAASMTVGSTLAMNYYVSGYDDGAEYYMVFTMNGVESEHVVGVIKNGYLVFSFTDIPPQHMGDSISASLFIDGNETPVDVVENYSVKRYAEKIIEKYSSDEKLMNLIADMLRYGAAAQLYRNYKTDELVTENLETNGFDISTVGSNAIPTESDDVRSMYPKSNVSELTDSVTAVGVRFDYDNKIYVKFKTDDIAKIKFTVTVNGTETNVSDRFTSVSDGVYIFYTDGISAIRFDQIFTFKMYVDGELHQTVTYSVNSYVYAKCGDTGTLDESTLPAMARLVRALYRYGLSAKAYKG